MNHSKAPGLLAGWSAGAAADIPEYFFYLMFQAVRRRDAAFESVLTPLKLTLAQWRALSTIEKIGGCTMTEVAAFTASDRTSLTRSLDQLVRQGLIVRQRPAHDRRQVQLNLTDAGRLAYQRVVEQLRQFNLRALGGLDEARQREISESLARIVANLAPDDEMAEALIRFQPQPSGKRASK